MQKVEEKIKYMASHGGLDSHVFHFVHFNYAVLTAVKEWPPCEVAVVKFSLINGTRVWLVSFITMKIGASNVH